MTATDVRAALRRQLAELETNERPALLGLIGAPATDGDRPGPGPRVVLEVGDGPEAYLLADFPDAGTPTITRNSPLGQAIAGAHSGQQVVYPMPRGRAAVTVVAIADEHPNPRRRS